MHFDLKIFSVNTRGTRNIVDQLTGATRDASRFAMVVTRIECTINIRKSEESGSKREHKMTMKYNIPANPSE